MGEVASRSGVGGGGATTPPVPTCGRSTLPIKGGEGTGRRFVDTPVPRLKDGREPERDGGRAMAESSRPTTERPLSPHLQVWRWHVTLAVSIAHRFAGIGLYLGLLLIAGWALAVADGPAAFDTYAGLLASPVGLAVLFLITLAAFFHMANGIRHRVWDLGFGFKPKTADFTALVVIAFAVLATIAFWFRMAAFGAFAHV